MEANYKTPCAYGLIAQLAEQYSLKVLVGDSTSPEFTERNLN